MIKVISCFTLVICCSLLGYFKASSYRRRCQELENIIELLKLLELEITYKRDPLFKTLRRLSEIKTCWFSELLKTCCVKLNNNNSMIASWEYSIDMNKTRSPLISDDVDILNDFILGLGRTDTEGQKKLFEPTIHRLSSNLKDATLLEHKLGKMYIALGTAVGAVTVILLI